MVRWHSHAILLALVSRRESMLIDDAPTPTDAESAVCHRSLDACAHQCTTRTYQAPGPRVMLPDDLLDEQ
eukprot:4468081-Pyramimonas_sp.AAC.1